MKRPDEKQWHLLREYLKRISETLNDETRRIESVVLTYSLDTAHIIAGGVISEKPMGYSKLKLEIEYASRRMVLRDPIKIKVLSYKPKPKSQPTKRRARRKQPGCIEEA